MAMEDLFRLARTSTVAQILERDDFAKRYAARRADLDPRAALPAAAGLRLGGGRARMSSSAAPTRSSTCCSGATSSRPTGSPPQSILTMPILPGIDGEQRMSKSLGQLRGRGPSRPEEVFGKLMRVPDAADAGLLRAAAGRAARPAPSAAWSQKRALARAIAERLHGAEARGHGGGALRPPARGARLPDDIEEHAFAADNGTVHLPALLADAFGLSRSEGRRLLARAGCRLDGEPLGPRTPRRPGRDGSTAPCSRWAGAASSGCVSADARRRAPIAEPWSRERAILCGPTSRRPLVAGSAQSVRNPRPTRAPRSLKTQQHARPKGRAQFDLRVASQVRSPIARSRGLGA